MVRLAFIVSHPIQYYAPLYQRLGARPDVASKVFFTWHDGRAAVQDHGFERPVAWDIPVTGGYEFELVRNTSRRPGTHRFWGLRNPDLVRRVMAWKPDAVHLTGWAYWSHLRAMSAIGKKGVPVLFRGDSHLLDAARSGPRWRLKRAVLKRVYASPAAFLVVGQANREYYRAFRVPDEKLFRCPHSVEVARFAEPAAAHEADAAEWRRELGIADGTVVFLFAGKLEPKKQPLQLMRALLSLGDPRALLIMVGNGALEQEVAALAAEHPARFRVLPFQNQSRMPVVYRLGDVFVLPSAYEETWGLAVNEAMACGRPVLVSDRVGCAADVVDESCGRVFELARPGGLSEGLTWMVEHRHDLLAMGECAARRAWTFDTGETERSLMDCLRALGLA